MMKDLDLAFAVAQGGIDGNDPAPIHPMAIRPVSELLKWSRQRLKAEHSRLRKKGGHISGKLTGVGPDVKHRTKRESPEAEQRMPRTNCERRNLKSDAVERLLNPLSRQETQNRILSSSLRTALSASALRVAKSFKHREFLNCD